MARDLELLLDAGADVNIIGETRSPLQWAAEYGQLEACELLLEKGATIEERGEDGRTPLMLASIFGHTEVVKLLLKSGAVCKEEEGKTTALCAAAEFGALGTNLAKKGPSGQVVKRPSGRRRSAPW